MNKYDQELSYRLREYLLVYNLHKTNSIKLEKLDSLINCIKQRFNNLLELKPYRKLFQKDIKESFLPEELINLDRIAISNKVNRRLDKICEEAFFKQENKKRKLESNYVIVAFINLLVCGKKEIDVLKRFINNYLHLSIVSFFIQKFHSFPAIFLFFFIFSFFFFFEFT